MAGLTHINPKDSIFGTKAGSNSGKSPSEEEAGSSPLHPHLQVNPMCPECSSADTLRDGHRYLKNGVDIQRWICKRCGYRFSEPPKENSKQSLKTWGNILISPNMRSKEAKNLEPQTENKTVAGDKQRKLHINLLPADARGLITKFMAYLEREGYAQENTYPKNLIHLAKDGANLLDPENVKLLIARQKKKNGDPWSDSMKMLAVCAYDCFCQMQGISWKRPNYHQNEATIAVPDEKDLDLLISAASKRMATFLLCLKETFADPSEILRCEWIDLKGNVLSINHPVKFHYPGKYELTTRLVSMINALPQKNKRIFPMKYKCAYTCLSDLRRKAARKFQNPALLQISFKSFRHWGGTMLAYVTNGNVPVIARTLRHKQWKSTQKYVHNVAFKEEDFEVTVATTQEEIQACGKSGWTKYDEITISGVQMHFYRKPKRFGSFKNIEDKS
jgi:integrase/Zn ribbon nucleic-acid-binding protein